MPIGLSNVSSLKGCAYILNALISVHFTLSCRKMHWQASLKQLSLHCACAIKNYMCLMYDLATFVGLLFKDFEVGQPNVDITLHTKLGKIISLAKPREHTM